MFVSAGDGCIPDLRAHEVLSSAWSHCWAHGWVCGSGLKGCLIAAGIHEWGVPSACVATCQSAALRPCTKWTHNHWFPLKYVQSVLLKQALLSRGWSFHQGWDGERRDGLFPSPLPGGIQHCLSPLSNPSVSRWGWTGVGVCRNLGEGLSLPSHEVCMELICDSQGQQEIDMSAVRQYPHVAWSCLFMHFLIECGRRRWAGLSNLTDRSLPWRGNVGKSPSLYYTAVMRQLLGKKAWPPERGGEGSAPLCWALWDSGFAGVALSPSSGHQCLSTRWNFVENREEPPKCVLE